MYSPSATRFNVDYKSKNLDVFLSLRMHVFGGSRIQAEGQSGQVLHTTTQYDSTYLFEAYAEPKFGDKFSVRIGRQRVMYDNNAYLQKMTGVCRAILMMP
jgi:hypothetical protein